MQAGEHPIGVGSQAVAVSPMLEMDRSWLFTKTTGQPPSVCSIGLSDRRLVTAAVLSVHHRG